MTDRKKRSKRLAGRRNLNLDQALSMRVRSDQFEKLQDRAYDEGKSVAQKVRELIAQEVAQQ